MGDHFPCSLNNTLLQVDAEGSWRVFSQSAGFMVGVSDGTGLDNLELDAARSGLFRDKGE